MSKIDLEMIGSLLLDINDRTKLILQLVPEDKNKLLKHFAAFNIHLTLFFVDLHEGVNREKTKQEEEMIKRFLNKCGCKELLNKEEIINER